MKNFIQYVNNEILRQASGLYYTVSDLAPHVETDLFNSPTLVIWSGSSDDTFFQDKHVNWAFRALHDMLHLETRMDFNPKSEIELGRIQANMFKGSELLQDLVYSEVSSQAEYYLRNGMFVSNQVEFTKQDLLKINSRFDKILR